MSEQRKGDWMSTFTGRKVYPLDMRPEDIDIKDIAHALSMLCRYGGHVNRFYSVAEHCLLMSTPQYISREQQLQALMHDAAEAYIQDMIRPLKKSMPEYQMIERGIELSIQVRFGLKWAGCSKAVAIFDMFILYDEASQLFDHTPDNWHEKYAPGLGVTIIGLAPEEAEKLFLERFQDFKDLVLE